MSNDVFNYLTMKGGDSVINKLKASASRTLARGKDYTVGEEVQVMAFSLDSLYPVPQALLEERAETEISMFQHWGTDRDVFFAEEMESQSGMWKVKFTSRWHPPLEALLKISGDYPGLTFTLSYWSCDSDFQGDAAFRDGECLQDDRAVWLPKEYEHKIPTMSESEIHPFMRGSILAPQKMRPQNLMERLTTVATKCKLKSFEDRKTKIKNERTGERIDANLWSWYFTIRDEDICEVAEGDVIASQDRRWRVTGSAQLSCGLAFIKYKRVA